MGAISRNTKCPPSEACKTLLMGLYNHFNDAFLLVAAEKGIANGVLGKKMDEVSIEAILSEAGINW